MSQSWVVPGRPVVPAIDRGTQIAVASVSWMVVAALTATFAPIALSIAVVFACAGPHNWMEARYVLARLPARWGKLRTFFLVALGGILALTFAFAALTARLQCGEPDADSTALTMALWDSALIAWILWLVLLRSRRNPRRDWSGSVPLGCLALAGAWLVPGLFGLLLVYGHPLMALAILDRELARSRPEWRRGYRIGLACLPALLALIWWQLAGAPDLPGHDALSLRIRQHAGSDVLRGVSSHALVATHTFLETIHYGVWLVAIPLFGLRSAPWTLSAIPMARAPGPGRRAAAGLLALGAIAVLVLWAGFLVDYPTTRDLYFTVALLHVLAEVPLLLHAV
jgi:hypothetical protein